MLAGPKQAKALTVLRTYAKYWHATCWGADGVAGWLENVPNKLKWTAGLLGGVALVLGATVTILDHLGALGDAYCRLVTCEAEENSAGPGTAGGDAFDKSHAGIWKASIRGEETSGYTYIQFERDGALSVCKLDLGNGTVAKKYIDARADGQHLRYTAALDDRPMHYDLKVYGAESIVGSAGDADDKYIYELRRPDTRTALEARVAELDLAAKCRSHP